MEGEVDDEVRLGFGLAIFCAKAQTEVSKYKTASVRATLPMNDPGGHRMTLLFVKDSAYYQKACQERRRLKARKISNRRVLASILA